MEYCEGIFKDYPNNQFNYLILLVCVYFYYFILLLLFIKNCNSYYLF
jgi:hypothetical protein